MNLKLTIGAGLLLALAALTFVPTTSAEPGVCVGELYQPGYDECFGIVQGCGGQTGVGVGHWYYDRAGNTYQWCYVYV